MYDFINKHINTLYDASFNINGLATRAITRVTKKGKYILLELSEEALKEFARERNKPRGFFKRR